MCSTPRLRSAGMIATPIGAQPDTSAVWHIVGDKITVG
jgi:hypothetical protein